MSLRNGKISVAENNRIVATVRETYTEYKTAMADADQAERCDVLPNCPECEGNGQVEIGTGDPAHNPTGSMCHGKCHKCKGKGYV